MSSPDTKNKKNENDTLSKILLALLFLLLSCGSIFLSSQIALRQVGKDSIEASVRSAKQANYNSYDDLVMLPQDPEALATAIKTDIEELNPAQPVSIESIKTPRSIPDLPILPTSTAVPVLPTLPFTQTIPADDSEDSSLSEGQGGIGGITLPPAQQTVAATAVAVVPISTIAPPTVVPPTIVPPTVVPPTVIPPTVVPPTIVPTVVPPTVVPPTAVPPTAVPPTSAPQRPSQPTATFTPTPTPTATFTPTPTATFTPTPTATFTPTPTATFTPTPTATFTPTITPPLPVVQFAATNFTVIENVGQAVITVTLSVTSTSVVSVDYASIDNSAIAATGYTNTAKENKVFLPLIFNGGNSSIPTTPTNLPSNNIGIMAGGDYRTINSTLIFAPLQTVMTFTVVITDDTVYELTENLQLILRNPQNAVLGLPNPTTLTIIDNDGLPTVSFSRANYNVDEGATTAAITVSLSSASSLTITVPYTVSNGTAIAGNDYTTINGTFVFTPGQLSQTFPVLIIDDLLDELNETVLLSFGSPTNAVMGVPTSAILTIIDNDGLPDLQLSSSIYSIGEAGGTALITVSLSTASALPVSVNYATSNITATAGSDYIAISSTLNFVHPQTVLTFTVVITDDSLYERDETLLLTLSGATNANLRVTNSATLTIVGNDVPPIVQLSSSTYTVGEAGGAVPITVTLNAPSAIPVSVNYATTDITTSAGNDYVTANGTLNFIYPQTVLTVTINVADDALYEGNESLSLSLSGANNATMGVTNMATLTIVDNDTPPSVQFTRPTYSFGEANGTVIIVVTLSSASIPPVSVNYTAANITALAGSDYTATSGVLNFNYPQTALTFSITITDDILIEGDETLSLTLSGAINAAISSPNPSIMTIVDND